ncbi:MAG: HDOD domain-containing protein [Rubrivivax sp.]|nr:HDOD domain-containing protein [Rubrivivax sp.]
MIGATVSHPLLKPALADAASWAARLRPEGIPVLDTTAEQVRALAAAEDDVDAHMLADAIGRDPLMFLKVMAHLARQRAGRQGGEPETLVGALIMLGIPPFFRSFAGMPTAEARLAGRAEARAGFDAVLRRSLRAARFALGFAAHRLDPDAASIHDAALLHDFAELLLWLEAPALALDVVRVQRSAAVVRSADAQRAVLGFELPDLQHLLMVAWRLPSLLVSLTDGRLRRETPQMANVRLAVRLARHSADGWDNAALPDDLLALGDLLQLAPAHAERLARSIDAG